MTEPISCTVEALAQLIHKAYCNYCLEVKGEDYWTQGDYNKLDDITKEADRYIARFIIQFLGPEGLKMIEDHLERLTAIKR
jgi:hypothetical protein